MACEERDAKIPPHFGHDSPPPPIPGETPFARRAGVMRTGRTRTRAERGERGSQHRGATVREMLSLAPGPSGRNPGRPSAAAPLALPAVPRMSAGLLLARRASIMPVCSKLADAAIMATSRPAFKMRQQFCEPPQSGENHASQAFLPGPTCTVPPQASPKRSTTRSLRPKALRATTSAWS